MHQARLRWVVCQLDALGKCPDLPSLRKALESLPGTLDETYDRIMCTIHEEYRQHALKLLQLLAYSFRPLRIGELVDAIAVNCNSSPRFDPENRFPDPEDILTICSSLVITRSGGPISPFFCQGVPFIGADSKWTILPIQYSGDTCEYVYRRDLPCICSTV
jgi:hypothetical protein